MKYKSTTMKKTLLIIVLAVTILPSFSFGQLVIYDIPIGQTNGLSLTSGDICTAPYNIEEARQTTIGNEWGATWMSTNAGIPTSVEIELMFTSNEGAGGHTTTLNGIANNNVDPGATVSCANGSQLFWTLNPAGYNPMASNTFLVDFSSSAVSHQLENLTSTGTDDVFMRVHVQYGTAGLDELNSAEVELVKITDLMGRETGFAPNTPLIYVYSDGTVRRMFQMEVD